MTDPEVSRSNRIYLGEKRYDRLAVAQENGIPYYVDEAHLTQMKRGEVIRSGVEIIIRETADPITPYWSKTVWDKGKIIPLPRYEQRLNRARKIANRIVAGRTIIESITKT